MPVVVGVQDELRRWRRRRCARKTPSSRGRCVAVPVADDGLVAGLAEGEGFARIEDAVAVEVEVPDAVGLKSPMLVRPVPVQSPTTPVTFGGLNLKKT